jgi:hypothetical protein
VTVRTDYLALSNLYHHIGEVANVVVLPRSYFKFLVSKVVKVHAFGRKSVMAVGAENITKFVDNPTEMTVSVLLL